MISAEQRMKATLGAVFRGKYLVPAGELLERCDTFVRVPGSVCLATCAGPGRWSPGLKQKKVSGSSRVRRRHPLSSNV